jgi:hypothetical protein
MDDPTAKFIFSSTMLSPKRPAATINRPVAKQRKCGLCGQLGHNRQNLDFLSFLSFSNRLYTNWLLMANTITKGENDGDTALQSKAQLSVCYAQNISSMSHFKWQEKTKYGKEGSATATKSLSKIHR